MSDESISFVDKWSVWSDTLELPTPVMLREKAIELEAELNAAKALILSDSKKIGVLNEAISNYRADLASEKTTRNAIIAKGVELERELQRVTAERDQYRDTLTAKHGGEPLALLSELDEARAELAALWQDKARLADQLTKCADLLNEVRTGEDFECVCGDAADAARAAMKEVQP